VLLGVHFAAAVKLTHLPPNLVLIVLCPHCFLALSNCLRRHMTLQASSPGELQINKFI